MIKSCFYFLEVGFFVKKVLNYGFAYDNMIKL